MLPEGVNLPDLPEPYATALHECVEAIFERYDTLAIVACGTIIRGVPDRRSDLDIQVLHRGAFRERLQRFFNGVPCEIFVNPPYRVPKYIEDEKLNRRPVFAHMYATGVILYDPAGIAAEVVTQAKATLAAPPGTPEGAALAIARYTPATMFEDAEDQMDKDPESALLLLGHAVYLLVQCRLATGPAWTPRQKDFMSILREVDPKAAQLAIAAGQGDLMSRIDAARKLSLHVTGADGFFEWDSVREEV